MKTKSESVEIAVGSAAMPAYVARPDSASEPGPFPGVLLFMEIFGVNAHIRSVADRVAAEGYVVVVPDLFHRTAARIELEYDEAGLNQGIALMSQVQATELVADLKAAHDHLIGRPDTTKSSAAMGFCFGGHAAYLAAATLPVSATASFYGGGVAGPPMGGAAQSTVDLTPAISGRILCLFGDQDGYIPEADVAKVQGALEAAGTRHEVKVYAGVGHGFFCDVRPDYNEDAASDAWARVKALFAAELS